MLALLLSVLLIVLVVSVVVGQLKAGPIRFRFPPASMARPEMARPEAGPTLFERVSAPVISLLLMLCFAVILFDKTRRNLGGAAVIAWSGVYILQWGYSRRD